MNNNLFSQRIKKLRLQHSMTGEELGKIMGVSKVSVWQWENDINYPNNNLLIKLSKFFNVSIDYLLGQTDIPNRTFESKDEDISFKFALYGEVKDLTEEEKQEIINYARYLKSKKK